MNKYEIWMHIEKKNLKNLNKLMSHEIDQLEFKKYL